MRLSIGRVSAGGHNQDDTVHHGEDGFDVHGAAWRRLALALAMVLILGSLGLLVGSSKPAGADTPLFASGQVFASVGNSAVSVYSQGSGNPLITRLNDGLQEPFTAGSAFDSSGNFYVTDDLTGDVSEYAPDGTLRRRLRQRPAESAVSCLRQPGQPLRRAADDSLHRRVLQDGPVRPEHRPVGHRTQWG